MENIEQPIAKKKPVVKKVEKRIPLAHRMLKGAKGANIGSNSHYCFYDIDGKYHDYFNDVCYARLQASNENRYNLGIDECRIFINQWARKEVDAKSYAKFVDYIVNRSIYANVFLSKKNWKMWGFRINCELSSSEVMAGITAIRQGYEYPKSLDTWMALKDKVGEDMAFYVSCFISFHKDKGHFIEAGMGGHGVLPTEVKVNDILTIVKEKAYPNKSARKPMKERSGGWSIFGLHKGAVVKDDKSFYNAIRKESKQYGEGWNKYSALTEEQLIKNIGEMNVKP